MNNWFKNILFSEYDQDPRFIALVRTILGISTVAALFIAVSLVASRSLDANWITITIVLTIGTLSLVMFGLTYKSILWPGKFFLPLAMLVAVPYIASQANGMHDSAMPLFPVIIIISTLLLGQKVIPWVTIATFVGISFVAYNDMAGINDSVIASRTGFDDIAVIAVGQIMAAGALNGLMSRLNRALRQSRENEQAQIETNRELRELQATLEERIETRTAELAKANAQTNRRALQLEAIASVSESIGNIRELEILLPLVTKTISEKFGFYHSGIFLIDANSEFAVLRAANSEGGQKMLKRNHKLRVGSQGIVGYVAKLGQARIALDIGEDAVFFNNPDLPETHSEIGLPLKIGDQLIGVLDVQSTKSGAFTPEDAQILTTLANQISIAIENTKLYTETRQALEQSQRILGQRLRENWQITSAGGSRGYRYAENNLNPIDSTEQSPETIRAIKMKDLVVENHGDAATMAIPIKLRDQVVGIIDIQLPEKRDWNPDEIDLAKAAAERAALAIETATLLDATQRRAEFERLTSEVSDKISSSTNYETILRIAAEELSRALGGSDVLVQIQPGQSSQTQNK